MVYVSANNSVAAACPREPYKLLLKVGYIRHSRLHLLLDCLRQRIVRLAVGGAVVVVYLVKPQQKRIAHVAEHGKPLHVGGDGVEDVAVGNIIATAVALVYKVLDEAYIVERERHHAVDKVVVVAPDVYYFGALFLHHLHYHLEEVGVFGLPFARAALAQCPAVYYVAVENEAAAVDRLQKISNFCCL